MLLVRHAWAGKRDEWDGDDRLRPLDQRGRRQAVELVELVEAVDVDRIVSSPYVRCVQTVEPLAEHRGLEVVERDELGEELQDTRGAELVRELLGSGAVVCCHGGLAELVCGRRQKKGEAFLLDANGDVERRMRPD
jgi:8-oxo-(d)GTP phosphatase